MEEENQTGERWTDMQRECDYRTGYHFYQFKRNAKKHFETFLDGKSISRESHVLEDNINNAISIFYYLVIVHTFHFVSRKVREKLPSNSPNFAFFGPLDLTAARQRARLCSEEGEEEGTLLACSP